MVRRKSYTDQIMELLVTLNYFTSNFMKLLSAYKSCGQKIMSLLVTPKIDARNFTFLLLT